MICDTRDFGIGRRVIAENWHALVVVGHAANRRLCDAQAKDAVPAPDTVTVEQVTCPSDTPDGLHAPGLRFGYRRVMALMAALVGFTHLIAGFDNPALVERVTGLIERPYTARQATYDLRRLRRKDIIEHAGSTRRYQLTAHGRAVAVLFTKAHEDVPPGVEVRVAAPGSYAATSLS